MDCLLNICRKPPPRQPTRAISSRAPPQIPLQQPPTASNVRQPPTASHLRQPSTAAHVAPRLSNTIVVGIDFGLFQASFRMLTVRNDVYRFCEILRTSANHLGCAIAQSSKVPDVTNKEALSEHLEILKQWPGAGNTATDKTPSILAYDDSFTQVVAWGAEVTDHHQNRYAHFKLLLHQPSSSEATFFEDLASQIQGSPIHSVELPEGKEVVDIVADYFRLLYQHVQQILSSRYGEKFLANQSFSYVITVPALWNDRSKALTLEAANTGGFKGNVTLVTEPEAAALYCATLCDEVDLSVGSKFLSTKTSRNHNNGSL